MSRASQAGNSVVQAAEIVCGMYGVPCFRQQSRVFTVSGVGGKMRPFFVGSWKDADGVEHHGGMSDLLALPLIEWNNAYVCVPLFLECKAGSSQLTLHQKAFRDYVKSAGAGFLELRDSADELIEWFKEKGVTR